MDAELGGDGVDAPVLGEEEPADLRVQLGRDHGRGSQQAELADVSEVAEAAEAVGAAGRAGPAHDEVDRDERGAGEAVHGGVPAW